MSNDYDEIPGEANGILTIAIKAGDSAINTEFDLEFDPNEISKLQLLGTCRDFGR
jgi:hypothetical protein